MTVKACIGMATITATHYVISKITDYSLEAAVCSIALGIIGILAYSLYIIPSDFSGMDQLEEDYSEIDRERIFSSTAGG